MENNVDKAFEFKCNKCGCYEQMFGDSMCQHYNLCKNNFTIGYKQGSEWQKSVDDKRIKEMEDKVFAYEKMENEETKVIKHNNYNLRVENGRLQQENATLKANQIKGRCKECDSLIELNSCDDLHCPLMDGCHITLNDWCYKFEPKGGK